MRVLITYQYFLPAYRAGGPIQSINNLTKLLAEESIETYIFCSNKDLDNSVLDVETDEWTTFNENAKVYYSSSKCSKKQIFDIIDKVNPDCIYINGLYSLEYTVYPLLYNNNSRKILSVRGMLHPGALSQKKVKKLMFITLFKMLGLNKRCEYHATTDDEEKYITETLGKRKVWTISNLPNVLDYRTPNNKSTGELTLVSVSLISPMKNILNILQALKNLKENIRYSIYGPIKDADYWNKCIEEMNGLPSNIEVKYRGEVKPNDVEKVLGNYHFFILPSKSENFGHAIYEAMSVGRPVVTSHNTPWNHLAEYRAGYNIDPDNISELTDVLIDISEMGNEEYVTLTQNAKQYITEQYDIESIKKQYINMFSK